LFELEMGKTRNVDRKYTNSRLMFTAFIAGLKAKPNIQKTVTKTLVDIIKPAPVNIILHYKWIYNEGKELIDPGGCMQGQKVQSPLGLRQGEETAGEIIRIVFE